MTECWRNVYDGGDGVAVIGCIPFETRAEAARHAGLDLAFRIHVRLKPEGAPKRYSNAGNRAVWERNPEWCRGWVKEGIHPGVLGSGDE